jgi:hypothetical protein
MFPFVVLGSLLGVAMLALQGCGSGGAGTTLTTTATTTGITTSTSTRTAAGGLRYCEDISTFYRVNIDQNGTKSAAGQCIPSQSPGAYYTKVGEKAQDGKSDLEWMCFNPTFDRSLWTNAAAQTNGFDGACLFEEFESTMQPGDVEDCSQHLSHHPAFCAPGPDMFWGACWSSLSENWKCVPKGDPTISGLAKGDCKAQVLLENGAPTDSFYDGACRFMKEEQKQYKCDTVPSYSASIASTCGGGDGSYDKACFSLKSGANWQCLDKDTPFGSPCDWTLLADGSKQFYKGACVFKGDEGYDAALDAKNLTAAASFRLIV